MTPRRVAIGFAVLGWLHNALRVAAALLGAGYQYLNYLPPYRTTSGPSMAAVPIAALILATAVVAFAIWYDRDRPSDARTNSFWSSALWSALTAMAGGLLAVWVSTTVERTYGWWLFVILPVAVGFEATVLLGRRREITLSEAMGISCMSVLLLGAALMLFAFEGLICLAMAAPIALPLAMAGGGLAYALVPRAAPYQSATFLLLIGFLPFGGTVERVLQPPAELFQVSTAIELPDSPERVWQTVLEPAKLDKPSQWLFRAGVAYPLASHIEGAGPSATRYCDFSTGKLVEPVLIWDHLRQLRFTVASNPIPMQEWSLYAQVHPPHLDGFLVSRQGEFRLTPLPGGGTRLEATTWYQHHLWPSHYWRWWSDYIIHQVHGMVLRNIRQRAAHN